MINGIRFKVCGLTSVADAQFAAQCGADYLGFIFHPDSPRYVSLEKFRAMAPELPATKKVAVTVSPTNDELARLVDAGFDFVQLHFSNESSFFDVVSWLDVVPPHTLWLAPRVKPGRELDPAFVPLAETFLLDTYHPTAAGGSGQTGDWTAFSHLRRKYIRVTWVLAGGLNPDNIGAALAESGAQVVDVNSGVESSPGVKDHAKLTSFAAALHRATPGSR
jgi:phosphoribosylanthranilate isomerase